MLGGVLLALGFVDYGLRYRRFEAMLRTSPEEQREDQRVMEQVTRPREHSELGVARSICAVILPRCSRCVPVDGGAAGLTLVIAGGPPPRRVSIRTVSKGGSGLRLRRRAESGGLPQVEDLALAQ